MAPRASRSVALPVALAAAGVCALCHYTLAETFAVPRAAAPQGRAFRQTNGGWQTTRSAAATLQAEQPVVLGADGLPVPSVGSIALQGVGVVALIGAFLAATFGSKMAIQGVIGIVGMYAICSVNEYVVHRYYQHLGLNKTAIFKFLRKRFGFKNMMSSGHVEHHAETLDDMSLDEAPNPILDSDPFRGTAFSWSVTAMMTTEIALQSYPFLWLCGWSFQASTAALAVTMLLHAAVWQTLHPAMHLLPDPGMKDGVPGWSMAWFRKSAYFRFLYSNHEGHHRVPGAHGNYNVCCPGADHLFGTYEGIVPAKAKNELCPAIETA